MTTEECITALFSEVDEQLAGCRVRGQLVACRDGKKILSRSTKRRADVDELPRLPVENRTVGRTYTARDDGILSVTFRAQRSFATSE